MSYAFGTHALVSKSIKQHSGELYSQRQSFVEPDNGPPMVVMLRRDDATEILLACV
jgi:hypothetical protein